MATVEMPANETIEFAKPLVLGAQQILPDEIKGVGTWLLSVSNGQSVDLAVEDSSQVIYFAVSGTGTAKSAEASFDLEPMSLFVPKPGAAANFIAKKDSVLLKIVMELLPEETSKLDDALYPMFLRYSDCEKYRDYFKSEKTVSRTLVHPFTLPRFCMGSVETTGPDRIEPHAHAMLDQLFFSFSNNDCMLLVDGESFRFGGNNLLHIPLGSEHGIGAIEGDVVHYLWLDFFEDAKEMQFLVDVHKPVKD